MGTKLDVQDSCRGCKPLLHHCLQNPRFPLVLCDEASQVLGPATMMMRQTAGDYAAPLTFR